MQRSAFRQMVRLLGALCVLCGSLPFARAETDRELVARIDSAVVNGVRYLATRQSEDGAWRSDVYAPFKEGDALTPLVMTAILPLPIDDATAPARERGLEYLSALSSKALGANGGAKSLAYPAYTAANVTVALAQERREMLSQFSSGWVTLLRRLQLSEASEWKPEDREYGGWTYGHHAALRPPAGQPLGTLDEPNLSATAFALAALQIGGVPANDPAMVRGLVFVRRLQNSDGGFYFVHGDKVRNKAGVVAGSDGAFRSYGSTTADGLLALIAGGAGKSRPAQDARTWLIKNFSADAHPGKYADDRASAQNGLYFYWAAGMSAALRGDRPKDSSDGRQWTADLAQALIRRQADDGRWQNAAVDQREDDPLVATPLALQALTNCRAILTAEWKPVIPAQTGRAIICHARDAECQGDRMRYEPQPQKNTLGCWTNAQDRATWTISVTAPGEYDVIVWQGCGTGQGGSELAIGIAGEQVKFTVEETGHFQNFRKRAIGRLKLPVGELALTLKCLKKAKGAVADIRQIGLIPAGAAR